MEKNILKHNFVEKTNTHDIIHDRWAQLVCENITLEYNEPQLVPVTLSQTISNYMLTLNDSDIIMNQIKAEMSHRLAQNLLDNNFIETMVEELPNDMKKITMKLKVERI